MTHEAMIRGLAKWIRKHVCPKLNECKKIKIGIEAAAILAEKNPPLAEKLLTARFPALRPIVECVNDGDAFSSVWEALTESVSDNGSVAIPVPLDITGSKVKDFILHKDDMDEIKKEMEMAYAEERNAATAVIAAGNKQEKQEVAK